MMLKISDGPAMLIDNKNGCVILLDINNGPSNAA